MTLRVQEIERHHLVKVLNFLAIVCEWNVTTVVNHHDRGVATARGRRGRIKVQLSHLAHSGAPRVAVLSDVQLRGHGARTVKECSQVISERAGVARVDSRHGIAAAKESFRTRTAAKVSTAAIRDPHSMPTVEAAVRDAGHARVQGHSPSSAQESGRGAAPG